MGWCPIVKVGFVVARSQVHVLNVILAFVKLAGIVVSGARGWLSDGIPLTTS